MQQGTVTRISEFTAEEKRRAIEDLVGMSTFDEKKLAAQKQLEAADNKLNIAFATMVQIKKQIEDLELQRNLQMRHNYMVNEIAQLQAGIISMRAVRLLSQILPRLPFVLQIFLKMYVFLIQILIQAVLALTYSLILFQRFLRCVSLCQLRHLMSLV